MKIATLILLALMIVSPAANVVSAAPQKDVPAEVDSARRSLEQARNDLAHAGGEWGGHRASAVKHIEEALRELSEAEKYARQHHDIK